MHTRLKPFRNVLQNLSDGIGYDLVGQHLL
uniref:Uncharacterized protein n=1 Tax=Siphoviridae sp. ctBLh2 TaxID=2827803 RepID=A0A8S5S336_9CAUD|nr:MAG TPA: hypothetical protein [Siphoviridae sp. ctBLh2]